MNIDQLKRDADAKAKAALDLFSKTSQEAENFEVDGKKMPRPMTAEERAACTALGDEAKAAKARYESAKSDAELGFAIEKMTAQMQVIKEPTAGGGNGTPNVYKSLGQQWVEDKAGQFFITKQHQGSRQWHSPIANLTNFHDFHATTLTTGSGSGGPLIVTDYRPGILPLLFKRLTVRDLLAQGTTDSNSVTYMKESSFTNAAAAVAEGIAKPESALVFAQVVDPVQKLAHWIPVSEEMLEDASQIRSYIDSRLRQGIALTEEDQLLNGNGTAPNIRGILQRVGLTAPYVKPAGETNAEGIFKANMLIYAASFIMPDGVVMNPANWTTTALLKDTTGAYLGSGPFAAAQTPVLWGLPVAVTPSIVANTALSGSFKTSAQIFDHGSLRVEASNSHADFFILNLVAIRAEERLALAVYRPAAFGTTTVLT